MNTDLVPVPWCPICDRNHHGSQCWPTDSYVADGRRMNHPRAPMSAPVGDVWHGMIAYVATLAEPPVERITESDVDETGVWVECELGESGCTGGDYTENMSNLDGDGWICPTCVNVANETYEQDLRDRELEYRRMVYGDNRVF